MQGGLVSDTTMQVSPLHVTIALEMINQDRQIYSLVWIQSWNEQSKYLSMDAGVILDYNKETTKGRPR
jgi:hypothetical protein